jgi:hypothetical protein
MLSPETLDDSALDALLFHARWNTQRDRAHNGDGQKPRRNMWSGQRQHQHGDNGSPRDSSDEQLMRTHLTA